MVAGDKKGPGKEEKAKSVEKLTDESLDKVSGGEGWKPRCGPVDCMPYDPECYPRTQYCQPNCIPGRCKPLAPRKSDAAGGAK